MAQALKSARPLGADGRLLIPRGGWHQIKIWLTRAPDGNTN